MKSIKRITAFIVCLLMTFSVNANIFATGSHAEVVFSSESVDEGKTFTATVSIDQTRASTLGISIVCSENVAVVEAKWLIEGLIASFDPAKNKAAFTRGAADDYCGDIFEITFIANDYADLTDVSITVIAKNSTAVVYEETISKQINVIKKILPGDVNSDGVLDSDDLDLLMKHINFYSVEIDASAADINGDGKINNKDYGLLQRIIHNN